MPDRRRSPTPETIAAELDAPERIFWAAVCYHRPGAVLTALLDKSGVAPRRVEVGVEKGDLTERYSCTTWPSPFTSASGGGSGSRI